MDQSFTKVMRGIGEALRLDDNSKYQEAYIQYTECVLSIANNLLQYVRADAGRVMVTKTVEKQVELGKQCMERLSSLLHEFNSPQDVYNGDQTIVQGARRFSAPVPPLQLHQSNSSFSLKRVLTPTERAYHQNQCIMKAYKTRITQISQNNPLAANLRLTIQRKLAENLAIANAQEKALSEKMKETQKRLDEQATRRFMAPIGMSEDEQEQRSIYKKILEYEQQVKWLREWRDKLASSPKDPVIISQLVTEILRCEDHPLTQYLQKYQYQIYEKLYPLVSTKMSVMNEVIVPLPQKLFPVVVRLDNDQNVNNETNDATSSSINYCVKSSAANKSDIDAQNDVNIAKVVDNNIGYSSDIDNNSSMELNSNSAKEYDRDKCIKSVENSEKYSDSGKCVDSDTCSDSETCVDSEKCTDREHYVNIECENNDAGTFAENVKNKLEVAANENEKLTEKLSHGNETAINAAQTVSKEYERYTNEDMDDLFDDEEDGNTQPECDFNLKNRDSDAYVVLSVKDVNINSNFCDNLYKFHNQSENERVKTMSEEAYCRHLKGISQDVHNSLEKLLFMFTIAYEELGSPEGQDQCYASIEEPFFKPIWKYLLTLFRLSNRSEEISLAYWMTTQCNDLPQAFGVSRKLCLSSDIEGTLPFQRAIDELRKLKDHYTMLSKLECIVNVCRLVCDCVENFYVTKQIEDGEISSAPSVGADDLLPILCYVVVKSALPQLVSECQTMSEFINEGYIMGEEGYCLTSLQTATNFVSTQHHKNL